jgi:hypothetical protein
MALMTERQERERGVEMRVHGIGDHEVFSALGKPEYKETADDRVWIGSLPRVPKHELKLINWSRASRKITRNLSWYLAYPFTLLNVAGYMGPEKRENKTERYLWRTMRALIVISSMTITFAMAAWITVILETAWRLLDGEEDRFSSVILCTFAPVLLAILIVNRMLRGRALADKGNWWVSLLTLGALVGVTVYLAGRPASKTAIFNFGEDTARDPMTFLIITTTGIIWLFALILCGFAWGAEYRRNKSGPDQRKEAGPDTKPTIDRTALAGAGILIALAIGILHTAGSILRLVLHTILKYTPPGIERRTQSAVQQIVDTRTPTEAGARAAVNAGVPTVEESAARAVLLPAPDDLVERTKVAGRAVAPGKIAGSADFSGTLHDYFDRGLRMDLVPLFFW